MGAARKGPTAGTYEPVIGLEIHAQLRTETKIFCSCPTRFGDPPGTNTCPVCLGMPGSLPVLNRKVVEYAVMAALATGCTVRPRSLFARKNYFYPDLPKGYQISQYEQPLAENGRVPIEDGPKPIRIGITRIHLEEDAGRLIHEGMEDSASRSYVDFNRCGVPLIEIVSKPEIRTPKHAYLYVTRLRSILLYLGVCDGIMEEGSLRCDANVSLRPAGGGTLGTKTEIKNLNSFRNVQRALEYEIGRQSGLLERGEEVEQETRLWNAGQGRTEPMRSKEEAMDYRYFPEPDLPPLVVDASWMEEIRHAIPELPDAKKRRYVQEWEIAAPDAHFLTIDPELAAFFEKVAGRSGSPRAAAGWVLTELTGRLHDAGRTIGDSPVRAEAIGDLIRMIEAGTISGKIAKTVFDEMLRTGEAPEGIVEARGLVQITDESAIAAIVDRVLAENPAQVEQYRSGKRAALGWFVGQVMRASRGRANPALVNRVLEEKLG